MRLSEGKGARKKGGQILSKKTPDCPQRYISNSKFLRLFFFQIVINYGLCVPWKFVNIISFGKAFPASFPYAAVYLVSWFSFLSVGSVVQLKDNGPNCLKRNLKK